MNARKTGFGATVVIGGGSSSWLSLRRGGKEFRFAGSHIRDCLDPVRDLIAGLRRVVTTDEAVTVEWKSEPGGVFLTFEPEAADGAPSGSYLLLVHDFVDDSWYRSDWDSSRGTLLFSVAGEKSETVSILASAIAAGEGPYQEVAERRSFQYRFPHDELADLQNAIAVDA